MFPEALESFRNLWKVSTIYGKFQDTLEGFRTIFNVSGPFGKCLETMLFLLTGGDKYNFTHSNLKYFVIILGEGC